MAEIAARLAAVGALMETHQGGIDLLREVISLSASVTNTQNLIDEELAVASAAEIDHLVDRSGRLNQLTSFLVENYPQMYAAQPSDQLWVSCGKGAIEAVPDETDFDSVTDAAAGPVGGVKPERQGLWTSTHLGSAESMWTLWLENYYGSTLFPLPWAHWAMTPAPVSLYSVENATSWVALVERFPKRKAGRVLPNWPAIAREYDVVRFTVPGVLTIQGITFASRLGSIEAGYWDVESLLWLRWRFMAVERLRIRS